MVLDVIVKLNSTQDCMSPCKNAVLNVKLDTEVCVGTPRPVEQLQLPRIRTSNATLSNRAKAKDCVET